MKQVKKHACLEVDHKI